MKRIIILLFLISYIFCSIESCTGEKDSDKCSNHDIEYKGFSCYKFSLVGRKYCTCYPDSSENQKIFFRFDNGLLKELRSINYEENDDISLSIFYPEKESYNKGEEIVLKGQDISEEDKKIILSKKTCRYLFWGSFFRFIVNGTLLQVKGYPNIEDKNTCFNAEQFPESKDFIDCGYAEIKYTTENNKQYTIKTCYFIPNDKMPEEFEFYLRKKYIDSDFKVTIPTIFYYVELYSNYSQYSENRRLDANNCEIIVEDKNGKKVKYTPDSTVKEVIGNGNDQNNNNNNDNNNNNNNNNDNNNNNNDDNNNNNDILGLNIILLLSLILLNF